MIYDVNTIPDMVRALVLGMGRQFPLFFQKRD
jgi:hypothetical protein